MVSTQTNAMIVALPTSESLFARPEIATAPSMPTNTQMVIIMEFMTWSKNGIPGSAPFVRFSTNSAGSNFCRKIMATSATKIGTILLMVTTAFTPAASFTPRETTNT